MEIEVLAVSGSTDKSIVLLHSPVCVCDGHRASEDLDPRILHTDFPVAAHEEVLLHPRQLRVPMVVSYRDRVHRSLSADSKGMGARDGGHLHQYGSFPHRDSRAQRHHGCGHSDTSHISNKPTTFEMDAEDHHFRYIRSRRAVSVYNE